MSKRTGVKNLFYSQLYQ
jgi:hypothetical protein